MGGPPFSPGLLRPWTVDDGGRLADGDGGSTRGKEEEEEE
jgi:hypothetical protein